eukprot:CAMPEP_0195646440 /NCGR_PEP_ID=MMETSP0815-20121206/29536_1 /TAXON_ID=97485 /ORGANISM="Prymnesium parvum, Strain Texoma1" /LENGTH=150 /DNA_ID=CAMNT_0040789881 /DNA_START=1 /DNA_END=449 /DNA_ORIENTATION=+
MPAVELLKLVKQLHIRRSRLEVLHAHPNILPRGPVGLLVKVKSSPYLNEGREYKIAEIRDVDADGGMLRLSGNDILPPTCAIKYVSNEELAHAELMDAALSIQKGELLQISFFEACALAQSLEQLERSAEVAALGVDNAFPAVSNGFGQP